MTAREYIACISWPVHQFRTQSNENHHLFSQRRLVEWNAIAHLDV